MENKKSEQKVLPLSPLIRKLISFNLERIRLKRDLNITQIAELSGVDRSVVSRYVSGNRGMTLENLLRLSKGLGVTPNDLLDGWEKIF